MLTKKDLSLIQGMLDASKQSIVNDTMVRMVPVVQSIVESTIESTVKKLLEKNTNDLIELITVGFHMQDDGFRKSDTILRNHEERILGLEKKTVTMN